MYEKTDLTTVELMLVSDLSEKSRKDQCGLFAQQYMFPNYLSAENK